MLLLWMCVRDTVIPPATQLVYRASGWRGQHSAVCTDGRGSSHFRVGSAGGASRSGHACIYSHMQTSLCTCEYLSNIHFFLFVVIFALHCYNVQPYFSLSPCPHKCTVLSEKSITCCFFRLNASCILFSLNG